MPGTSILRDTVLESSILSVALHPFKAAVRCAKLDVEYKFANSPFALILSPELYEGTDDNARRNIYNSTIDPLKISGWGINPGVKVYFDNGFGIFNTVYDTLRINHFVNINGIFRSFDLAYSNKIWVPVTGMPFPAYELQTGNVTTSIAQRGVNVCYGMNFRSAKTITLRGIYWSRICPLTS